MRYSKKQIEAFLASTPGRKATQDAYNSGYQYGFKRGKLEVSDSIIQALGLEPTLRDLEDRIDDLEANR